LLIQSLIGIEIFFYNWRREFSLNDLVGTVVGLFASGLERCGFAWALL